MRWLLLVVAACQWAMAQDSVRNPHLPSLNWVPRSDWINATQPATFPAHVSSAAGTPSLAAVGDGIADDTAAIQQLLNRLTNGDTLYFPAGRYRITKTLHIDPGAGRGGLGITLVGHGRDTVLFWDGEAGGTMFFQNTGWAISRYLGLTWDGRGRAAIGFLHRAMKLFETEVRHDHEAFLNFTSDGIHLGGGARATAEISYNNCLFEHCGIGLHINGGDKRADNGRANFNYLDNTVRGCEFRNCSKAIHAGIGTNVYVRFCHFEGIRDVVLTTLGEAGNSIRHCSARDIGLFVDNGSSVGPLTVQDCYVKDWRTARPARHPDGVITLRNGNAPSLLFDNTFETTSGMQAADTPIVSVNPSSVHHFLANNRVIVGDARPHQLPLKSPPNPGWQQLGNLVTVADGGGVVTSASQRFFRSEHVVPPQLFDAKRDFGAVGDGKTDDTEAVQRTIDAARTCGRDSLAYLPKGRYVITAPLKMTGSRYRFGGCGFGSALIWRGPEGGTTLEIVDPDKLTLEHIVIGRHDYPLGTNARDIVQTSSPSCRRSRMHYEHVGVFGMYAAQPATRGLQFLNLKQDDVVCIDQVNGNVHVTDSAESTIYLGLSYEGTVTIEGKKLPRNGFVGANVRLSTHSDPGLLIKDNHSFVISDLYCESSNQYMRLEGDEAFPAGVVVASGPKFEIHPKFMATNPAVDIRNYKGNLIIGPYNYYVMNPQHWFRQEGASPFTLTMWASNFYNSSPRVEMSTAAFQARGLRRMGSPIPADEDALFANTEDEPRSLETIAVAIERFRRLGQVSYDVSYPRHE